MLLVDLSGRNWRAVNSRRHFERLRAARVRGALIKATEGATFVNERYRAYRRWALDVGMLVGPYHFAYPTEMTPRRRPSTSSVQSASSTSCGPCSTSRSTPAFSCQTPARVEPSSLSFALRR
jgi:GH25 family lysozyme M1 (1,4-beta-N-acetylmuramidase)